ncbi:MAG: single-stranded-DNA-specific exonuclease RecJ [Chloroflexi bacterium]|nr:single-stranded-DNA-specific exonuclease RecJ [Chloroflexota bacterium]
MSEQLKELYILPEPPAEFTQALSDLGPVMAKILYNRGLTTPQAARAFLSDGLPIHNPFQLYCMSSAVARIRNAIKSKERIIVYGDFDADGVTSTALLVETLEALGAKVAPYIPDRIDEGYGLNIPALEQLAQEGVGLIITVDCGIRSIAEVEAGIAAGLDIIVTDHHSVGEVTPRAYAVINPKQPVCKYPEKMLAGVGIAYKLASALLASARAQDRSPPDLSEHDLLDLVALGTVADLAPLDRPENRRLVQLGLQQLAKARRPGIYALMDVSGIRPEKITTVGIGYGLGPRINAAGRLEDAKVAYELLRATDLSQASSLAQELQQINVRRQQLTTEAYDTALGQIALDPTTPNLLFAIDEGFSPGIVGLVAGKLTEAFYRPSVVIQKGEEESHGSCRSIPEFNITHALDQCADLLLRHGGHAQAAGFTIMNENLDAFRERLNEITEDALGGRNLQPTLAIDAQLEMIELTMELARKLQALEPMGTENPEPVFFTRRLSVVEARRVGSKGHHLKLRLADGPLSVDAIAFRLGEWFTRLPPYIDVAYHLQINEWNGRTNLQMNVIDIRPTER